MQSAFIRDDRFYGTEARKEPTAEATLLRLAKGGVLFGGAWINLQDREIMECARGSSIDALIAFTVEADAALVL